MKRLVNILALLMLTPTVYVHGQSPGSTPSASLPLTISYKGFLRTSQSTPAPDGNYTLQFDLFDSLSGGFTHWQEIQNSVAVNHGTFSVAIGSNQSLAYISFLEKSHLEVKALDGPAGLSYPFTFSPRSEIASAPNSLAPWVRTEAGEIYYAGSGNVGIGMSGPSGKFSAGAAEFNGNVAIGTDSPGERLTIAGSMEIGTSAGDYRHLRIGGGNSSGFLYGSYAAHGDGIQMGYNCYFDATGNQVIPNIGGATSRLSLGYGRIGLWIGGVNHSPNAPGIVISDIGRVGIGTYTPGYLLQVGGGGDGTQARANTWSTFSDRRFKRNITQIDDALGEVLLLRGIKFNWIKSGEASTGFIAQEVEKVLPEVVSMDGSGYESMDYSKLAPVLVEAIKAQQKKIEALKKIVKQLTIEHH
ncbi:MAG TPA: tail fiber domain-containing protein [Bacteroidota bacterium]|nr:tail fiber domain-containing protein [Bacteroidota bacterium]